MVDTMHLPGRRSTTRQILAFIARPCCDFSLATDEFEELCTINSIQTQLTVRLSTEVPSAEVLSSEINI